MAVFGADVKVSSVQYSKLQVLCASSSYNKAFTNFFSCVNTGIRDFTLFLAILGTDQYLWEYGTGN